MTDKDKLSVTLAANAGILVETSQGGILTDALYCQRAAMFSSVPLSVRERIWEGRPPFDHIRWLMFTHFHDDHFGRESVQAYLEKHSPEKLIFPAGLPQKEEAEFRHFLQSTDIEEVSVPMGECQPFDLAPGCKVFAFPCRHAAPKYREVPHVCYGIFAGEKKILILGDADYDSEFLGKMAGGITFDAVIANPLFVHLPRGRKVLLHAIKTKALLFYHVPFHGDDKWGRGFVPNCKTIYNSTGRSCRLSQCLEILLKESIFNHCVWSRYFCGSLTIIGSCSTIKSNFRTH